MILLKEKIEYEQANELFRHYHRLQWISGTVFISAAFAILGLTWEIKQLHLLFLFSLTSVILYGIWAIIQERYQDFVKVTRDRIWELEKMMGLDLHLKIKTRDDKEAMRRPIFHALKRMHNWTHYIMPFLLLFLWVFRIILALLA